MTPNPILKVLSTLTTHQVAHLLMGGQACVLYGAAEFSRDTDIAILAEPANLERLERALAELRANCIAVPPFARDYLMRGHAIHFRCQREDVKDMRLDVMAVMRGVAPFAELWARRTTLLIANGTSVDMLSLPDLVQAKKTQREKDWGMLRRLIEGHYAHHRENPTPEAIDFWLREGRTPELLIEVSGRYPEVVEKLSASRPLLSLAQQPNERELHAALIAEMEAEMEADRRYWQPLRQELEQLRHERRTK